MKKLNQIFFYPGIAILFMIAFSAQSQMLEDDLLIYYSWNGDQLDHSGNEYDPAYFSAQYVPEVIGSNERITFYFYSPEGFAKVWLSES